MQVVIRSLRVLSLVAEHRTDGLTLSEIASTLDLPISTIHRIVTLLIEEDYVRRDIRTLCFFPGPKLAEITGPPLQTSMLERLNPHLRSLSAAFNETVFATQLVGFQAICVAMVTSKRPLHLSVYIGHELPLHAAASARVLLAFQPEDESRALLEPYPFTRFTDETPRSVEDVMQHLKEVRARGYDICQNELDQNVWAVAVPIRYGDQVIASMTLATPLERSPQGSMRDWTIQRMLAAAEAIASEL
jgi:IclR family acetate operon transcriptional repressor